MVLELVITVVAVTKHRRMQMVEATQAGVPMAPIMDEAIAAKVRAVVDPMAMLAGFNPEVIMDDGDVGTGAPPSDFGIQPFDDMEHGVCFKGHGQGQGESLYQQVFSLDEDTQKWHTWLPRKADDGSLAGERVGICSAPVMKIIDHALSRSDGRTTRGFKNAAGAKLYIDRIDRGIYALRLVAKRDGYKDPFSASRERAQARYEQRAQQSTRSYGGRGYR